MAGHFFHQPEVFFTRDIFQRAGGKLREDLYYSMDYELWVRMARAGANAVALPEIVALFRQHGSQKTGGEAPGETKQFRLPFDSIPESWNQARPDLVIAAIDFV